MTALFKLNALLAFPRLVPNAANQRVFLHEFGGREFYVRFFPAARRSDAVYQTKVHGFLRGKIVVPELHAKGMIVSRDGAYYYLAERKVDGTKPDLTPACMDALSRDLKKWHSIPVAPFLKRRDRTFYRNKIEAIGRWANDKIHSNIVRLYDEIDCDEIFEDVVVSHGDIASSNMIYRADANALTWIDLDQVSVHPRMADISEALLLISLSALLDRIEGRVDSAPSGDDAPSDDGLLIRHFLDRYGVADSGADRAILAKWVLHRLVNKAAFYLHPNKQKIRSRAPVLYKGVDSENGLAIHQFMLARIDENIRNEDPVSMLCRIKMALAREFRVPYAGKNERLATLTK